MNVERAIEHILAMQAQAEARMDRAESRMEKAEARMDRTDRQMKAIQKLIQTGMKLVVQIGKAQKKTDLKLAELAEAQLKSDRKLDRLIETLNRTYLGQNAATRCCDLSWLILAVQSTGYN